MDTQVKSLLTQADVSKDIVEDMIEQHLRNHIASIVRETCSEYVQGIVREGKPEIIMNQLTDDITGDMCYSMVRWTQQITVAVYFLTGVICYELYFYCLD